FLLLRRAPSFTLFPYTTLFRSVLAPWSARPSGLPVVPFPVNVVFVCALLLTVVPAMLMPEPEVYTLIESFLGIHWEPLYLSTCPDRKSTRLNSSHDQISYAVFC